MEDMETDSLEELWRYDNDQEMMDGFFSRKVETKKPTSSTAGCDPAKKTPEKKNLQSPSCPQKAKPAACPPEKQQQPRAACPPEKSKPCPSKPAEKSACPKKVKREACGVVKKKKKKKPPCGNADKRRSRKKQKMPRSRNPFIIFFLKMLYNQCPQKHVTEVAREAGKKWCCMSKDQKKVYQQMACLERRRRCKSQQRQARRAKRKC